MTKQQLIAELLNIVSKLVNRDELFTARATCKLIELIQFMEDETDKELDAIHVKTTLALIMHDLTKVAPMAPKESTLTE